MEYLPKHDIKLMVTSVVFVTLGTGANAIPSRSSFLLKKTDGSDADQVTRESAFPLPISWIYYSCLGRFWEPLDSLAPASFAVHLPSQGEVGSWEHWIPNCLFISCRGKAEADIWCYKAYGFGAGQLGAYNTGHTHQGLPHQGFFLPHPCQQAVRMVVQNSWLFWGFEVPSCSLAFSKEATTLYSSSWFHGSHCLGDALLFF